MLDLYKRILEEAKKNGLNGDKIGALLGLKKSPLTDWKNGHSIPTTEQIIKLCEIFAVSSDYLLFGTTNGLSMSENELITNYQKLSDADKQEILNIIEYKLYSYTKKEISSSLNRKKEDDSIA